MNLRFEKSWELVEKIYYEYLQEGILNDICIVADYETTKALFRDFIREDTDDEYEFKDIELEDPELDNYNDEHYFEIDPLKLIYISKARTKNNSVFKITACKLLLIQDGLDIKEIEKRIDYSDVCVFAIGKEKELTKDEPKAQEINMYDSSQTGVHGFCIHGSDGNSAWSKSFYSQDIDLVNKMLDEWK